MTISSSKRLIFELSGEHPELPFAELEAVLSALYNDFDKEYLKFINGFALFEIKDHSPELIEKLAARLAMCRTIYEVIVSWSDSLKSNRSEISRSNERLNLLLEPNQTFSFHTRTLVKNHKGLRANKDKKDVTDSKLKELSKAMIRELSKTNSVSSTAPDVELVLFFEPNKSRFFLVKKIKPIDRSVFEHRKAQFRPFFAPISLHPRLARCLVNLAGLPDNGIVLDPFSGTGGILLEAGLMGFSVLGSDIDSGMVEGTKANLDHWGVKEHSIFLAEIDELPEKIGSRLFTRSEMGTPNKKSLPITFAIVTEPPYGRATSMRGESIESLLERAFLVFHQLLTSGSRLVISLPDKELAYLADSYFTTLNIFELRIHRSLTKHICVFSRK